MRRLLGTKVDISSLAMEYPGDGKELLYNPRASFKVIVYMDSLYCAECEVVKISVWNEHFHLFKSLGVPVYFVFNNNSCVVCSLNRISSKLRRKSGGVFS